MDLERVVYISGIHGCGKSTLRKALEKREVFLLHNRPGHVKLDEPYQRQLWRLVRYHIEAVDQQKWQRINSDKIILGDRCVYDNLLYNQTFTSIGWISPEENQFLSNTFEVLFPKSLRPQHIIHLAPPLEWVKGLIEKRWDIEGKKWREDDFGYLEHLYEFYEHFYAAPPCPTLRLTTTNRQEQIESVVEWLKCSPSFKKINM